MLGATSLATFLAQFGFDAEDTMEVVEIYRVSKELCNKEARTNFLATTGFMSKLGRRLGELSTL